MPAEPEVAGSGPPRPLAEIRAETGFAWSCRQGRAENGELTEVHQITSGDRGEYERHMRGHGLKPLKSAYEPPKPWKPPRPAREHAPKPMDPGQRVEWVTVTEAHHENPGHLAADGTYVPASGAWIAETRRTRAGVVWSIADTASAWWVQPDDDPAHPVYVKRAGKSWRDRGYGEGTLHEVPGYAEAARTRVLRGELVRRRGIFPVTDAVIADPGGYLASRDRRVYITWHCDPACPRAQGRERYDPATPGIAYGYLAGRGAPWTPLDVAEALASGEQPPSDLCPDCIVNLDVAPPATPAPARRPEPGPLPAPPEGTAAVPAPPQVAGLGEPEPAACQAAAAGAAGEARSPRRAGRFALQLEVPATDAEFLESCARLGDVLGTLAGQVGGWAEGLAALSLPPSVLGPLRQLGEGIGGAAAGAGRAAAAFEDEFGDARDVAARGMHFTGQGSA